MKITLKNIKHSKFASQETLCFEASIYVDGVRRGFVENSGRGECNHEHWIDRTFGEKVYEYIKTLPEVPLPWDETETVSQSLDLIIDELMNDWLAGQEVKKQLRKGLLVVDNSCEEGQYHIFTHPMLKTNPEGLFNHLKREKKIDDDAVCLNLLPIEEAVQVYRMI
jgi:hypothetical protein